MSKSQACVSDLAIDRYLAQEFSTDASDSLESHAASCPRCSERLSLLRTDAESTRDALPALAGVPQSRAPWVGMLAVAAGLVLAVMAGRTFLGVDEVVAPAPAPDRIAQTRTKGRAHLTLYVRRDDRVRAFEGETLRAGDALAFAYTSSVDTHLAVFDVDGGEVTCLHPGSLVMAKVGAGTDVEIDLAVALDKSLSEESIVAVFCDEPEVTATLADALSSGSGVPPSCSVEWIRLPKEGR